MVQFDFGRIPIIALLLTLHLVTLSQADCTAFCNEHRPSGSSDGYTTTCHDVAKGNWEYKYSDCSHKCGLCPEWCSDGSFQCPPSEWPTSIIVLNILGMFFLGGVIAVGVYLYRKRRQRNRIGDAGMLPDGQPRSNTESTGMMASVSNTESQSRSIKDPVPVTTNRV